MGWIKSILAIASVALFPIQVARSAVNLFQFPFVFLLEATIAAARIVQSIVDFDRFHQFSLWKVATIVLSVLAEVVFEMSMFPSLMRFERYLFGPFYDRIKRSLQGGQGDTGGVVHQGGGGNAGDDRRLCKAYTLRNKLCRNHVASGSEYCNKHRSRSDQ